MSLRRQGKRNSLTLISKINVLFKPFSGIVFFTFPVVVIMSLLFTRLTHPLSIGLALLFQTCLVCISAGLGGASF